MSVRAFTIIELLVVCAIVSVLLGLLLPALSRVRESARINRCSTSLRTLALGVIAYHFQHERYPPCPSFNPQELYGLLEPHVDWAAPSCSEAREPWTCPSDRPPGGAYFSQFGTSFRYYFATLSESMGRSADPFYRVNPRLPLFIEARFFHGGRSYNASFADGHVRYGEHGDWE